MAFVARRNTKGKLVNCQVINGTGSTVGPLSDISDEDTDSGTVAYSDRSYVSPTVRYVAIKEEENNLKDCYTFDGTGNLDTTNLDTNLVLLGSYRNGDQDQYGETDIEEDSDNNLELTIYEGNITETKSQSNIGGGGDADAAKELMSLSIDTKMLQEDVISLSSMDNVTICNSYALANMQSEDAISLDSIGCVTICHSQALANMQPDDVISLSSIDNVTICNSQSLAYMQPDDVISLSSIDNVTICDSQALANMQPEDVISLDSIDCATICCPSDGFNMMAEPDARSQFSVDSTTVDQLMTPAISMDNLSNFSGSQCQQTNRTYNIKSSTVRRDDCSSVSTCSWTDMYGGIKPSEGRSNIVPSLSLNLSTTGSSGSSTYFRTIDNEKECSGQEAYEEWVKRKERQKQQKLKAAKQERDRLEAQAAMRQRLANKSYEEWCRRKQNKPINPSTGSIKSGISFNSYASAMSSSVVSANNNNKPPRKETPEARRKRLDEWDRAKKQQQQRDRERQRQQRMSQEENEKQRKQKSEGAWQNWMKSVGNRPKPVPLNQGFDTLRGTISNIYCNPIQWVSNIDPNDTRNN